MSKSIPKRYTQQQITKILFAAGPGELNVSALNELHRLIWCNPKDPNSLHLNTAGWLLVAKLKMTFYSLEFKEPLTNKVLLQLDRYLQGPYFVYKTNRKLALLDEQDHVMLQLNGGNLAKYLDDLEKYS